MGGLRDGTEVQVEHSAAGVEIIGGDRPVDGSGNEPRCGQALACEGDGRVRLCMLVRRRLQCDSRSFDVEPANTKDARSNGAMGSCPRRFEEQGIWRLWC